MTHPPPPQGARGFYRGYFTTVMREIPFSFIQYPLWEYFKVVLLIVEQGCSHNHYVIVMLVLPRQRGLRCKVARLSRGREQCVVPGQEELQQPLLLHWTWPRLESCWLRWHWSS